MTMTLHPSSNIEKWKIGKKNSPISAQRYQNNHASHLGKNFQIQTLAHNQLTLPLPMILTKVGYLICGPDLFRLPSGR
jgi:hypothetical protein